MKKSKVKDKLEKVGGFVFIVSVVIVIVMLTISVFKIDIYLGIAFLGLVGALIGGFLLTLSNEIE